MEVKISGKFNGWQWVAAIAVIAFMVLLIVRGGYVVGGIEHGDNSATVSVQTDTAKTTKTR